MTVNDTQIDIANYEYDDQNSKLFSIRNNAGAVRGVNHIKRDIAVRLEGRGGVSGKFVQCNEEETVFYTRIGDIPIPCLVVVDGSKFYCPNDVPVGMDGSVLFQEDYEAIIRQARAGKDKTQSTCDAVIIIHDEIVLRLQNLITSLAERHHEFIQPVTLSAYYDEDILQWRGIINNAKFCVNQIWQQGKVRNGN